MRGLEQGPEPADTGKREAGAHTPGLRAVLWIPWDEDAAAVLATSFAVPCQSVRSPAEPAPPAGAHPLREGAIALLFSHGAGAKI